MKSRRRRDRCHAQAVCLAKSASGEEGEHPDERQREQAEERHQRAAHPEPALADHDGRIADVRPRQELAQADRFGEIRLGHPAPLLDHDAVRPRHHAAEGARADREEAEEKLAERFRRRDVQGSRGW
jgi:hypothetical protein